jgi:hypothetical protein
MSYIQRYSVVVVNKEVLSYNTGTVGKWLQHEPSCVLQLKKLSACHNASVEPSINCSGSRTGVESRNLQLGISTVCLQLLV